MFYKEENSPFLKIYTSLPNFVVKARQIFENGQISFNGDHEAFGRVTYESNMPFALRFMIDNDIGGM